MTSRRCGVHQSLLSLCVCVCVCASCVHKFIFICHVNCSFGFRMQADASVDVRNIRNQNSRISSIHKFSLPATPDGHMWTSASQFSYFCLVLSTVR